MAWSIADCSDIRYAPLVNVAPDTVATLALCAASASCCSFGNEVPVICAVVPVTWPGSPFAAVSFPFVTVIVTVSISYTPAAYAFPVYVPSVNPPAALLAPALAPPAAPAAVAAVDGGGEAPSVAVPAASGMPFAPATGGVPSFAPTSSPVPAMVPRMASTPRRIDTSAIRTRMDQGGAAIPAPRPAAAT